jgi:hypothetical protein
MHLVTPIINFITSCNDITKKDLSHTKIIIAGAAAVGPITIEKFLAKADKYILFQEGNTEEHHYLQVERSVVHEVTEYL